MEKIKEKSWKDFLQYLSEPLSNFNIMMLLHLGHPLKKVVSCPADGQNYYMGHQYFFQVMIPKRNCF